VTINRRPDTFERIAHDKRHWGAHVLFDRQAERAFGDWTMEFERPIASGPTEGIFRATASAIAERPNAAAGIDLVVLVKTFYRVQSGAI